jgi:hypothetical protein
MRIVDRNSMTRNLPNTPRLAAFPSINIVKSSLPAHNAEGQGLVAAGPRPAPPVLPNIPTLNIPAAQRFTLSDFAAGRGAGQGIVPNTPLPAVPNKPTRARVRLDADYARKDQDLSRYNLRTRGVVPQGQYSRPSHTMEIYGPGRTIDVSHIKSMKSENYIGSVNNHGPSHNFGGDPRFEADHAAFRPTAAQLSPSHALRAQKDLRMTEFMRANSGPAATISGFDRSGIAKKLAAESRSHGPRTQPLQNLPIRPAPVMPSAPKVSHLIPKTSPMRMEANYIAPPIRGADLGGTFSSMSSVSGNIGVHPGRAFGAEAHLFR